MTSKFRIHVLGLPYTKTHLDYVACAFTQKILLFCKMMHQRGHYIIHYGVEGSNPECDENVVVLSDEEFTKEFGVNKKHTDLYKFNTDSEAVRIYTENCIKEISKRKQKNDFILPFWGCGQQAICESFPDMFTVEPGIGYIGAAFAPFKIYESYFMLSYDAGRTNNYLLPSFYDVVIPPFFDLDEFEYNPNDRTKGPDRYFAFLGRIGDHKGVNIALQVCKALGVKLKIGGQPCDEYKNFNWPDYVEYVGHCDVQQRKELFKNAIGTFVASRYMEPFGYVQIESLLCGTPIITTDWGAFPEVNIEGVTGYRCQTFNDFLAAALHLLNRDIDYINCRKRGEDYRFEKIAPLYEKHFQDILNLTLQSGWYTVSPEIEEKIKNLKE